MSLENDLKNAMKPSPAELQERRIDEVFARLPEGSALTREDVASIDYLYYGDLRQYGKMSLNQALDVLMGTPLEPTVAFHVRTVVNHIRTECYLASKVPDEAKENRNAKDPLLDDHPRSLGGAGLVHVRVGNYDEFGYPIETAPKDGSRILILTETYGYSHISGRREKTGAKWVEAFWGFQHRIDKTKTWVLWSGQFDSRSTEVVYPLLWAPKPGYDDNPGLFTAADYLLSQIESELQRGRLQARAILTSMASDLRGIARGLK